MTNTSMYAVINLANDPLKPRQSAADVVIYYHGVTKNTRTQQYEKLRQQRGQASCRTPEL